MGLIVGSEIGVMLALLGLLMLRGESDSRQFSSQLAILSTILVALVLLRRKAIPAGTTD